MGGALMVNGQPTVESIKTKLNVVATKKFSSIIALKASLSISLYIVGKKFFASYVVI